MGIGGTSHWRLLERWSPTLFLVAGGILAVYAALNGLWAFTDMVAEQNGLEIGYVLGFLGLLGLYPTLADRSPWLARAGAVAAVCGIVALSFISVNDLARLTGITSGNLPGWSFFRFLPLVGFVVGYLSFGAASLRSSVYPRSAGLLLLTPGVIVVVMLVHIFAGYASDLTAFVISAGEAMAHLAIGSTLRTKSADGSQKASVTETDPESTRHGEAESTTDD